MRQVVHMMGATIFLLLGSEGKPISQSDDIPSFADFHQKLWAGEVDLADNEMKVLNGMVHWSQLLQNMRHPRFEESLRIVSDQHTGEDVQRLLPVYS
jgi:hypothetical protein